jgi:hypothetical protein
LSNRRQRSPSFDELGPPPASGAPLHGLTDVQWAARGERRERNFRIVCGVIFGGIVGMLSTWHWGAVSSRSDWGTFLVIGGSMLLFAALFAQRRDHEAVGHAAWIVFPEWSLLQRLPLWAIVAVLLTGVGIFAALAVVVFLAHLR